LAKAKSVQQALAKSKSLQQTEAKAQADADAWNDQVPTEPNQEPTPSTSKAPENPATIEPSSSDQSAEIAKLKKDLGDLKTELAAKHKLLAESKKTLFQNQNLPKFVTKSSSKTGATADAAKPSKGSSSSGISFITMPSMSGLMSVLTRRGGERETQPENVTKAAKEAADQLRRPLPTFPLIPIKKTSELRKAIDTLKELLMSNDLSSE